MRSGMKGMKFKLETQGSFKQSDIPSRGKSNPSPNGMGRAGGLPSTYGGGHLMGHYPVAQIAVKAKVLSFRIRIT